jgi:hypothetical protein
VANSAKTLHKFTAFLEAKLNAFAPFLFEVSEDFHCEHDPCFRFLIGPAGNPQVPAKL